MTNTGGKEVMTDPSPLQVLDVFVDGYNWWDWDTIKQAKALWLELEALGRSSWLATKSQIPDMEEKIASLEDELKEKSMTEKALEEMPVNLDTV